MDKPSISVLLCVYNPDKEDLYAAVESIKNQSMRDWEMLVYDDGSEKEQEKYIREIVRTDQRIKYHRNDEHHSLAYGLNALMKHARGKYIARMDGDDISHPDRFQKSFEFLETHPEYAWVGCNTSLIDSQGNVWGTRQMPETPEKNDFLRFSPYIHPAVMFRSHIVKFAKYTKSDKMLRGEDYELFMRLHSEGQRGYNLQEELFFYREDTQGYKRRNFVCSLEEVRIRRRGFKRLQITDRRRLLYTIKPLIVWAIPNSVILRLKKRWSGTENEDE